MNTGNPRALIAATISARDAPQHDLLSLRRPTGTYYRGDISCRFA